MSTVETVKNGLNAIIDKANAKTGGSDSTVNDAVDRLIAGYNPGGTAGDGVTGCVMRTVTLDAVTGANAAFNLLTNDAFVAAHYADDGFFATIRANTPATSATGLVHFAYAGNKGIGSSNVTRYGVSYTSTSASAVGVLVQTVKINGTGYGVALRAASDGSLKLHLPTDRSLAAGDYEIVLGVAE